LSYSRASERGTVLPQAIQVTSASFRPRESRRLIASGAWPAAVKSTVRASLSLKRPSSRPVGDVGHEAAVGALDEVAERERPPSSVPGPVSEGRPRTGCGHRREHAGRGLHERLTRPGRRARPGGVDGTE
jgi:hypothetical protein